MLIQSSHSRPTEAQSLGPLWPSPGAPVLRAVQSTSRGPSMPSLPATIQPWAGPPLRGHARDCPPKGTCHRSPGLPGEAKDNQRPQPNLCPAVQGSSGHQLWAPRSIWVEETVEGTKPVERPEMGKMVTLTPRLSPRAPGGGGYTSQRWFGEELLHHGTIKI